MPDTPETIIAFDFGLRRIGVAIGQQVTNSSSALETVANGESGPDWLRIGKIIREWAPHRLIVGMPLHVDGFPSETSELVSNFVAELDRFELPIETVDERYSSVEAQAVLKSQRARGLRGRISKASIDSAAAALIAERWLKNER